MGAFLSLFSGVWGYVAAAVFAAGLSGYAVHKFDNDALLALKLADQRAATAAVQAAADTQKRQDDVALNSAVSEAQAQEKIVTQTRTITKEITVHVPDTTVCVPVGLVRVLHAAATGDSQDPPGIAAGQSDDSCAAASWRSIAADLTDDYGTARQNAEQLNALEDSIRNLVRAAS